MADLQNNKHNRYELSNEQISEYFHRIERRICKDGYFIFNGRFGSMENQVVILANEEYEHVHYNFSKSKYNLYELDNEKIRELFKNRKDKTSNKELNVDYVVAVANIEYAKKIKQIAEGNIEELNAFLA